MSLVFQKIKNKLKKSKKIESILLGILYTLEKSLKCSNVYFYMGKTEAFFSHHQKAEQLYKNAIALNNVNPKYYVSLSKNLEDQKKWWQIIEPTKQAISLAGENLDLYLRLANALEHMRRYQEASEIYTIIIRMEDANQHYHYRLGYTLEKTGNITEANQSYQKAIMFDDAYNSKELGIGVFHEKKGLWTDALKAYKIKAEQEVNNALVHYKLGYAYDRNYEWELAQKHIEYALNLDNKKAYMFYNLACIYERSENYVKATKYHQIAIEKQEKFNSYWIYRLAYSLYKQEEYKVSSQAFQMVNQNKDYFENYSLDDELLYKKSDLLKLNSLELTKRITSIELKIQEDMSNAELFYELALLYELDKNYNFAEENLKLALLRESNFKPYWYFKLGCVQDKLGKYKEACESFIEQRVIQEIGGTSKITYFRNSGLRKSVNYTQYYEKYSLDESMILYESYHGASVSCNPYAIFKMIFADKRFLGYTHIWAVNDNNKIPKDLKSYKNIIFVKRDSDLYMRYLAKAKYLINNVTFSAYFIRKDGQIYLNTWHGTPIKFLGKDIKDDFMAHKNVTRNFLQATHLIQPNKFTTDILTKQYDVKNIFNGLLAHTGYPRQDLMLNASEVSKRELNSLLKIDSDAKVVLYAPTWRGLHGQAVFDTKQLLEDIEKINKIKGIHFLFRGHHMIESLLEDLDIKNSIVPSDIDTNTLLSIVDILVTDYSSIAFDFMAREKPIIYYAYDEEEYTKQRGLYFPLEDIAEDICHTSDELVALIEKNILRTDISEKQAIVQKRFCNYDDGKASKKVIDLVFFNEQKGIDIIKKDDKKSLLLYGGPFIPNGITTSFINLLNHIDSSKYTITIVLEPHLISSFKERLEQIGRVNSTINIVARVGRMSMTLEEKWIIDKFNILKTLPNEKMIQLYNKAFLREFKRIFGGASFDYIVNFEGYNVFWTSVLGSKQNNKQINSIYLHNNMYAEWTLRFPYLEKNFRLYHNYDKLISVSNQTNQLNRESLSDLFNLDKNKFLYCDNIQNPEDALIKSQLALENKDDEFIFNNTKVFINIARLSPEKDQEKLIRAFQGVSKKYPEARLINLGSGPLEHDLKTILKQLKLEEKVFLLGQRSNPYSYLKKSDCFILSSNHEGQPMTLFEALILNKPIIATNIVGNKSVLEERGGLLVENSQDGLERGMLDFLEHRYIEEKTFDYKEYNQMALDMFFEKVC
jgi:CDP-glycerol glycerophosphotransferase